MPKSPKSEPATARSPLICDWCDKPYAAAVKDNCKCGIKMPWMRKPELPKWLQAVPERKLKYENRR